jgi:5-methyltetrahydropteroyltriglutamate--homocysteine methyltransferase
MTILPALIGYPRIGRRRELKWALERAWSGRMERDAFAERVAELREEHLAEQRAAVGSACDDFFLYDEALETALMLGLVPGDLAGDLENDPFGVLSADRKSVV